MTIYLARHGQTDWNLALRVQGSTDVPLNATGLRQAEELADALEAAQADPAIVYSSVQQRALRTGKAVAGRFGIPEEAVPGLQEMDLGIFEGLTWPEIRERYPEALQQWQADKRYARIPRAESYQDVMERAVTALEHCAADALSRFGDRDIVILSHGGVITSLMTLRAGLSFDDSFQLTVKNATPYPFTREDLLLLRERLSVSPQ